MIIQKRMKNGKRQIKEFQQPNEYAEFSGNDGEPNEFERNIFPGFTLIEILEKIRRYLGTRRIIPEQFEGKILVMMTFNEIDLTNFEFQRSKRLCEKFSARTLVILRSCK